MPTVPAHTLANTPALGPPHDELIDLAEVCRRTSLSARTIWQLVHDQRFPAVVHPVPRATRWSTNEVAAWIESRKAARPMGPS